MSPQKIVILLFLLAVPGVAQKKVAVARAPGTDSQSKESARLPVKRVVLYKNGVGYFEHTARVHGTQELNIEFTTGQLNDVLKSLTAVDISDRQHLLGSR